MVFLLYKALQNKDISQITLPSCKIEERTSGDVNLQEDIDDEVREVPTYIINFPTVLSLVKVEYEHILKDGWSATFLEDQTCGMCSSELNVLGYPNANDALANNISAETVEELTHGERMSGYINCHCRFHLECLLKHIWPGLTMKVWRCEHHQTCANTIFVANNLGFPERKYLFSNIEDTETNARGPRTARLIEQCLKTQLTLCQSVSDAYSIKFGSFSWPSKKKKHIIYPIMLEQL